MRGRQLVVLAAAATLLAGFAVSGGETASAAPARQSTTYGSATSGVSLAGTVTAAAGGTPIAGVRVVLVSETGESDKAAASALTDAHGAYKVSTGLQPYTPYEVCFDPRHATDAPATGFVGRCYGDDATDADTQDYQPVSLSTGEHRTGLDAALVVGARITGTVTDGHGHPLAGVGVGFGSDFFGAAASVGDVLYVVGSDIAAKTGPAGHYTLNGVAPGPWVTLNFDASTATGGDSTTGYLDQTYDHASGRATPIALVSGQHVAISAALDAAPTPPSGSISGTVVGVHGKAVRNANVEVTFASGEPPYNFPGIVNVTTDKSGHYTASGLPNGGYDVCVGPAGAEVEPFDSASSSPAGTRSGCHAPTNVKVTHGAARTGINITVQAGAEISGRITDKAGHGIGGVLVEATLSENDSASFGFGEGLSIVGYDSGQIVKTSANGSYSLPGLASGTYTLCFDASSAHGSSTAGYMSECYNDKPFIDGGGGDDITLGTGAQRVINASLTDLRSAPSISGRVTDAKGAGVADVAIVLEAAHEPIDGEGYYLSNTATGDDGRYTVYGVSAGSLRVCAYSDYAQGGHSAGGYLDDCGASGRIDVTVGTKSLTGVNFTMAAAAGISGVVTDGSGNPISSGIVDVFKSTSVDANPRVQVVTRQDGTYNANGLPAGVYRVCVDPTLANLFGSPVSGFAGECDGGVSWNLTASPAPDVKVAVGHDTALPTIELGAGGVVTGHVTDAHGHPLAGVSVDAQPKKGDPYHGATGGAITGPDGSYEVAGLTPGSKYTICFSADRAVGGTSSTGYAGTCNGGAPYDGFVGAGTAVKASTAGTTIDMVLPAGGAIAGTVRDSAGYRLAGAPLDIEDSQGDGENVIVGFGAITYDDGTFDLTGLPAGSYSVCGFGLGASAHSAYGYVGQCYKGKPVAGAKPTPVAVALGTTTTGIDITLAKAGAISGKVVDKHGKPVGGVDVLVGTKGLHGEPEAGAETGKDGTYLVTGVPAGTHVTACFLVNTESGSSCYKGLPVETAKPTTFTVVAGHVTSGIDGVVKP
ncbi:carboxypeptidase-like regulatory domain-containing protein [Jatrophihabitans sp.]|uniref:carboxypeptidase-like regulatory domain-containing protein n=1 Tax=Jatrophihabitans sp. TaxID=1932789 RepID=UPI0030C66362|nr:S-layer domain protein [Jatrophihabitans sp.]